MCSPWLRQACLCAQTCPLASVSCTEHLAVPLTNTEHRDRHPAGVARGSASVWKPSLTRSKRVCNTGQFTHCPFRTQLHSALGEPWLPCPALISEGGKVPITHDIRGLPHSPGGQSSSNASSGWEEGNDFPSVLRFSPGFQLSHLTLEKVIHLCIEAIRAPPEGPAYSYRS